MSAIFEASDPLFTPIAPTTKLKATGRLDTAAGFAESLKAASASAPKDPELPPIAGSNDGIYANVVVNGKVVASIANSGCALVLDGYAMKGDLATEGEGPDFAQQRAEAIAQALGGRVQKLSTAKTQQQWQAGLSEGHVNVLWSMEGQKPGYDPRVQMEMSFELLRSQEVVGAAS